MITKAKRMAVTLTLVLFCSTAAHAETIEGKIKTYSVLRKTGGQIVLMLANKSEMKFVIKPETKIEGKDLYNDVAVLDMATITYNVTNNENHAEHIKIVTK